VLAIPGTGDPDHLAANVTAGALRLSAEEMSRLTSVLPAQRQRLVCIRTVIRSPAPLVGLL